MKGIQNVQKYWQKYGAVEAADSILNLLIRLNTVFDRSFEHYGSFEHLHFPHSFAISRGYFAVPQLFINALHRKMMILDMKIILELCNERIGRKWVV
jgi:hypothetical protein